MMLHTFLIQNHHDIAPGVDTGQFAVEPLAPVAFFLERDLRLVPRPVGEVGGPRQRPVDAGRRHPEPQGAVDRVLAGFLTRVEPAGEHGGASWRERVWNAM